MPRNAPGRTSVRKIVAIAGMLCLAPAGSGLAASKAGTRLWNLTGVTLNDVRLAPAGTQSFGPNQCLNDKDGEVDFDERLPITRTPAGRYDVRLRDVDGRVCLARDIEVRDGEIFALHERDLRDCRKP
jgi:hypothetical protein